MIDAPKASDIRKASYGKADVIKDVVSSIKSGNIKEAFGILEDEYPFVPFEPDKRSYTIEQKLNQFLEDGFIDRYSGERLVNPGILKVISHYLPDKFPYHPHWKTTECHIAYWELSPTIDHVVPIAKGGYDGKDNWVTTSMMRNMIKSHWTLEQLQWELHPRGDIDDWDGLTEQYMELIEKDPGLLSDSYIKRWYLASKRLYMGGIYNDDILFELKILALYGAHGAYGGYGVMLRMGGELSFSEYMIGNDTPASTRVIAVDMRMAEEVFEIIDSLKDEIRDIPKKLNNGSCDGTEDIFRFRRKRICAWNITMTDTEEASEGDSRYLGSYYENMVWENRVLSVYDRIAEAINRHNDKGFRFSLARDSRRPGVEADGFIMQRG